MIGAENPNVVVLTNEEMDRARKVAKQLHDKLRSRGVRDGHGLRREDATAELEAGGAQAELAAAKFYGVNWSAGGAGHDKNGPDIGEFTQIRSSAVSRPSHHLIVRSKDWQKYQNVPFVLVIQEGNRFIIKGWMMSEDALKVGRLWDGGDSGRPKAWFVHESKLHAPNTLKWEDI